MIDILSRAGCFVAIIFLGWLLRRVGFFGESDFKTLSKIVIKITLTCAIITNFDGQVLDSSLLLLTLIGFLFGVVLMVIAWLLHRKAGREKMAFAMLNISGCNIGNFVVPFAQTFLGPAGVMAVSLFDVGNAFICLGGAYGITSTIAMEGQKFSIKPVLKALSRSVPFLTHITMTVLTALHLHLPRPMIQLAGIIGNANAFLAMFMIGVGFRLTMSRDNIGAILRILIPRFALAIVVAVLGYFFLPINIEYRQALVILILSPIASSVPAFTAQMGGDHGLSCALNSFSIVISLVLICTALVLVL